MKRMIPFLLAFVLLFAGCAANGGGSYKQINQEEAKEKYAYEIIQLAQEISESAE